MSTLSPADVDPALDPTPDPDVAPPADGNDTVARLRHAYEKLAGRPPAADWDAAELRARLAADAPPEGPPPPDRETASIVEPGAPWRHQVSLVPVVITVDHVYLPLDSAGNGRVAWQEAESTVRVTRRTRVNLPADLAAFLSQRDQAEIVG